MRKQEWLYLDYIKLKMRDKIRHYLYTNDCYKRKDLIKPGLKMLRWLKEYQGVVYYYANDETYYYCTIINIYDNGTIDIQCISTSHISSASVNLNFVYLPRFLLKEYKSIQRTAEGIRKVEIAKRKKKYEDDLNYLTGTMVDSIQLP